MFNLNTAVKAEGKRYIHLSYSRIRIRSWLSDKTCFWRGSDVYIFLYTATAFEVQSHYKKTVKDSRLCF